MIPRNTFVLACLLFAACASEPPTTSTNTARLTCSVTADCAARGGSCVAGECHATNECVVATDCAAGQTCEPDPDFDGLCTTPGQPPSPLPAWSCTYGMDCPAQQGCGSDGKCHLDGECHNTWQGDYLVGDCALPGQICAASGDPYAGFCTDGRGGPDPYCRSTGTGECRGECTTNDDCGNGNSCVAGYCHRDNECATTADCSPNHTCGNPANWDDYGYLLCLEDENPTCTVIGNACRLACDTDNDCFHGGGCATDGYCHASNECTTSADCDPGLMCIASAEFGGLCGLQHQ